MGGTTTYYLLVDRNPSGYVQVLEEWTVTSTATNLGRVYNYGLSLISQRQVSSGTVNYYGFDGHGSTRFLTSTNGTVTDTYMYDTYGTLIASTGSTSNSYLYCCQQFDVDLGQYYLRARTYNPGTGRFWTMDTYQGDNKDPLSLHKYLYGVADPVDFSDLSGLLALIPSSMSDGDKIHQIIADQFALARPNALPYNTSLRTVLNKIIPYQGIGRLRPDLIDQGKHEIYDIKSAAEIPEGIAKKNNLIEYYC